jgi:hypothetical protein
MFEYITLECGLIVQKNYENYSILLGTQQIGKFLNLYNMKQLDIFHPEIFDEKINSYKVKNYSYLNLAGYNVYLKVHNGLYNIEHSKIEFYSFLKEFLEC